MRTNFTIRDFFVYLLTGVTFILSVGIIFFNSIFEFTIDMFEKYIFIKDFSFLVTIFLIPIIYLLGHFIGSISYNTLQLFIWADKKFKKRRRKKWKYRILMFFQLILYRQRIVYAIISYAKSKKEKKLFKSTNEFWIICSKLEIEKIYGTAKYWYVLNELFNAVNLIFLISTILSLCYGYWILSVIYFSLTIFAFKRAKQYAEHFINTVCGLIIARQEILNETKEKNK